MNPSDLLHSIGYIATRDGMINELERRIQGPYEFKIIIESTHVGNKFFIEYGGERLPSHWFSLMDLIEENLHRIALDSQGLLKLQTKAQEKPND